jgi:hypothetical protein
MAEVITTEPLSFSASESQAANEYDMGDRKKPYRLLSLCYYYFKPQNTKIIILKDSRWKDEKF